MNQNAAFPAPDGHQLLSLLHRPPTVDTTEPWLLVLMHGVGSNEDDLFALADFVPAPFHVLSLRAPFVLGPGSYAWFEFMTGVEIFKEGTARYFDFFRRSPGFIVGQFENLFPVEKLRRLS